MTSPTIDHQQTAGTLVESLQWIRLLKDKTVVVCMSEAAINNSQACAHVLEDVLFIASIGARPVVLHGGSVDQTKPIADIEQQLAVELNQKLATEFESIGGRAMTLNFESGHVLSGEKHANASSSILGVISSVDRLVIDNLCYAGQVPFIPAMCLDPNEQKLLLNEFAAAAAVAASLNAEKLVVVVVESLEDYSDHAYRSLPSSCSLQEMKELVSEDSALGSVIEACLPALEQGVGQVQLINTDLPHGILLELFTTAGIGLEIRSSS